MILLPGSGPPPATFPCRFGDGFREPNVVRQRFRFSSLRGILPVPPRRPYQPYIWRRILARVDFAASRYGWRADRPANYHDAGGRPSDGAGVWRCCTGGTSRPRRWPLRPLPAGHQANPLVLLPHDHARVPVGKGDQHGPRGENTHSCESTRLEPAYVVVCQV